MPATLAKLRQDLRDQVAAYPGLRSGDTQQVLVLYSMWQLGIQREATLEKELSDTVQDYIDEQILIHGTGWEKNFRGIDAIMIDYTVWQLQHTDI